MNRAHRLQANYPPFFFSREKDGVRAQRTAHCESKPGTGGGTLAIPKDNGVDT